MADTCVNIGHCGTGPGTGYPGWLSGGHPTVADGVAVGKTCFNTISGCFGASVFIRVRNCGKFYVYNLLPIDGLCYLRYCGNGFEQPTTTTPGKDVPLF